MYKTSADHFEDRLQLFGNNVALDVYYTSLSTLQVAMKAIESKEVLNN